jgi:hypothetical protein
MKSAHWQAITYFRANDSIVFYLPILKSVGVPIRPNPVLVWGIVPINYYWLSDEE